MELEKVYLNKILLQWILRNSFELPIFLGSHMAKMFWSTSGAVSNILDMRTKTDCVAVVGNMDSLLGLPGLFCKFHDSPRSRETSCVSVVFQMSSNVQEGAQSPELGETTAPRILIPNLNPGQNT
jgi:hypothetical protein